MPSNKPKVQALLTKQYFEKLKKISEKEDRSISQMTGRIIERYIDEYETKNGNIIIQNNSNFGDININTPDKSKLD